MNGLCFPDEPTAVNPDWFFATPGTYEYQQAATLCSACPLHHQCRSAARLDGVPYGLWGGEPKKERERHWDLTGGRPRHFAEMIEYMAAPLLQERRDYENWDRLKDKERVA